LMPDRIRSGLTDPIRMVIWKLGEGG